MPPPLKTYTLYLLDRAGAEPGSAFEPALCVSDAEALAAARRLLAARSEYAEVLVCFGPDELFRVAAPRPA